MNRVEDDIDKAIEYAVASTEMEGFTVSDEQKDLMKKVLSKEITLKEAIDIITNNDKK